MFSSSAPARIGILGNPSDIYGGKIIAMTIQYRAKVSIKHSKNFSVRMADGGEADKNLQRLIEVSISRLMKEGWIKKDVPIEVSVRTEIPRESGMGGSTAIIVALLDAYRKMFNLTYDRYRLAEIVQKIEHKELGIVAGYNDRYAITFGGLLFMDFTGKDVDREVWEGEPYAKIREIPLKEEIPLVCGYWGVRRSSGSVHAPIRRRFLQGDIEVIEAIRDIIKITEEGEKAIIQSDWKKLSELMNQNYDITKEIGWAYKIDDKLRKIGLEHGAIAAKLGGAGNGGVMVFLAPNNRKPLMKALRKAGAKVFIPQVSEGVR